MKRIGSKHAGTDDRKKEIILAALECFTETGMESAAIGDICRRAKASTGSLYHHFGSKEKLAAAVYLEGIAIYQAGFVETLESAGDARSGIFGVIAYHLEWVEKNPVWAKFIMRERHAPFMGENEDELSRLNMDFVKKASEWFRRHIASGSIKRLTPGLYQAILMGPVQEYVKNLIMRGEEQDIRSVAEELGAAAWASLKA
jgi:AcrR family transcriptional regulator